MLSHKYQEAHDESTADSVLGLLLDLVGDALQNTAAAAKHFTKLRVLLASSALHTIPSLQDFISFQVPVFAQHESLTRRMTQDSMRRFLSPASHDS